MFFLLYRQKKDIDKIIDFYSPMQKVIVTAQIYSTAIQDIVYNNLEKRALQWQNISKALKNV